MTDSQSQRQEPLLERCKMVSPYPGAAGNRGASRAGSLMDRLLEATPSRPRTASSFLDAIANETERRQTHAFNRILEETNRRSEARRSLGDRRAAAAAAARRAAGGRALRRLPGALGVLGRLGDALGVDPLGALGAGPPEGDIYPSDLPQPFFGDVTIPRDGFGPGRSRTLSKAGWTLVQTCPDPPSTQEWGIYASNGTGCGLIIVSPSALADNLGDVFVGTTHYAFRTLVLSEDPNPPVGYPIGSQFPTFSALSNSWRVSYPWKRYQRPIAQGEPAWRWKPQKQAVPRPAPDPGPAATTKSVRPDREAGPAPTRAPRAERATQVRVNPQGLPVLERDDRPPGRHLYGRKRERKVSAWHPLIVSMIDKATETADFIDALWNALPPECQSAKAYSIGRSHRGDRTISVKRYEPSASGKLADLAACWDHLDVEEAIQNLVANGLEDALHGRLSGAVSRGAARSGGFRQGAPGLGSRLGQV